MKRGVKGILALIGVILLAVLIATVPAGADKGDDDAAGKIPFVPVDVENWVDPVTVEIEKMKAQGMSDDEIVLALEEMGLIWDPDTGAKGRGWKPTPEELRYLGPRTLPARNLSPETTDRNGSSETTGLEYSEMSYQQMHTTYHTWNGIRTVVGPGSLAIDDWGTSRHIVTTYIISPSLWYWTEAGVLRDVSLWNGDHMIFTYDNDEGEWWFHWGTSADAAIEFIIFVWPIFPEPQGYVYSIWIDQEWVRSGHLPTLDNFVYQANEAWSTSGYWTNDSIAAYHTEPYLYDDFMTWKWNGSIDTIWEGIPPVQEFHFLHPYENYWCYYTWVVGSIVGDDNDETEPEFGGEWADVEKGELSVTGLYNWLVYGGEPESRWEPTPRSFLYGEWDAWERHWKRHDNPYLGDDINYVDRVDLAMFQGHGTCRGEECIEVNALVFLDYTHDDKYLEYYEAKWGDWDLEWVFLHACHILNDQGRDYWEDAFNGIHLLCGAGTVIRDWPDGAWVGYYLVSEGPTDPALKVIDAWYQGCDQNQRWDVVLWVGAETLECYDDYVWGQGDVCDDPPVDGVVFWDYHECQ